MHDFFERLSELYRGDLKIIQSKWYNGHAYLPLTTYSLGLSYETKNSIQIKYEYRQSEFGISTTVDGGAFADRHIFDITAKYHNKAYPKFEIVELSWFHKLLKPKGKHFYVKCRDSNFRNKLLNSYELGLLYERGSTDAEFSPYLKGKPKEKDFYIEFRFSTKKADSSIIELIIQFLLKMDNGNFVT